MVERLEYFDLVFEHFSVRCGILLEIDDLDGEDLGAAVTTGFVDLAGEA
jgi:hypothetical protein